MIADLPLQMSARRVDLWRLRRGEAHLAGSHLLDPETGEYNISYIRQYMPNIPVKVVALVGRDQGLIGKEGKPKGNQKSGRPHQARRSSL